MEKAEKERDVDNLDIVVASGSGVNQPLEILLSQTFAIIQNAGSFYVNENHLNFITEMGFPRPEVRDALRASLNTPNLAIEFLSEGLPVFDILAQIQVPAIPSATIGDGNNYLGFLGANQHFAPIRRLLSTRPELLTAIMLSLQQLNPGLLSAIQEHPRDFLRLLRENELPNQEPEPAEMTFTPEEQSTFDRIVEMGFPAGRVFRAFLACGMNEDATIDSLCDDKEYPTE